ncbi:hypothetical protein BN1048_00341 [Jeotgalicoccus saudimassiliensis]|uniref:YueH-like protein n=1 Tax=Jeotgalicoccus saudimassiliensis TaxID=1461582 RepID=A0A078LZ18_9STAP|nr:YueH family protein [Jeotgalicoccus saudimassiliensis]CDZ99215.1 hypothetical protein BN1048_00341 [Jeotgalicoccus saudimassiliensis]
MLTQTIKFNGTDCTAYTAKYEDTYIISIPELGFSMQMDSNQSDEEMTEELIMHLFTLLDEDESSYAAEVIQSAIKAEQGDNNGY